MLELIKLSKDIIELSNEINSELDKVMNSNKRAAQRVRTKSIELEKLFKAYRKLSLENLGFEKKDN